MEMLILWRWDAKFYRLLIAHSEIVLPFQSREHGVMSYVFIFPSFPIIQKVSAVQFT